MKKVALITGGGKGIGYDVARAFAKENYNLVITGRTQKTLEDTAKEINKEFKVDVLQIVADGGIEKDIKNVLEQVKSKFGRLDVLINNAQASKSGLTIEQHTKEDFDLAINSGLYAVFFYMRECLELLKESKGSVINFASGAGLSGRFGQSSYAAAKEGIRGLSRVAATEWGQYGININVVCPLVMTEQLAAWKEQFPDAYEKNIQGIPMGRFGDGEKEIGGICLFLASPAAKYISGETITAQGGSGLRP